MKGQSSEKSVWNDRFHFTADDTDWPVSARRETGRAAAMQVAAAWSARARVTRSSFLVRVAGDANLVAYHDFTKKRIHNARERINDRVYKGDTRGGIHHSKFIL